MGALAARAELTVRTSYLGGSRMDTVTSVAVDASGNIYVAGWTESDDLPVANAAQSRSGGGVDAFVAKLTPGREALIYLTYLGGSFDDRAFSVAVDGSGNAYVAGATSSPNFPAVNAYQGRSGGGRDAFIAKLSPGGVLLYNTYIGGSGADVAQGIAIDGLGNVYAAGVTDSADFPIRNAAQAMYGGVQDGFVLKLNQAGALVYSTYVGGSLTDSATAIAVDASGCAYITGSTESSNFPSVSAFQPKRGGGMDAFVVKVSASGQQFVFSSYLGGASGSFASIPEYGAAIAVGADEAVYVAGVTGPGFPVAGTVSTAATGAEDAFAVKIARGGGSVVFARYLGGRSADYATSVAVTKSGQLGVAGYTSSPDFPNAATRNGFTGYLVFLEPDGRVNYKAAAGAEGPDTILSVALRSGNIYVAGQTRSVSLPSPGPVGPRLTGMFDGFVGVLADSVPLPEPLRFVPVPPCRLLDTREGTGAFGGPALAGDSARDIVVPDGPCGIPRTAKAYSLNVAVVPFGALGFLTVWPAGQARPLASTLNSDGRVKSNAAIVGAGTGGAISVYGTAATALVLDINGYFVDAADPAGLTFYAVNPCRVADTRSPAGTFGGPRLAGGASRTFPIPASPCGIPSTAKAYMFNFTSVPKQPGLYVTAWPTGASRPNASSLNAARLTPTANAVIVPAGTGGSVDVFTSGETDLVIDVNGYFAPPGLGGLALYPLTPCRVLDTRLGAGAQPFGGVLDVYIRDTGCGVPIVAQGYVLNATAVPAGPLGYLTLWPYTWPQPGASCLNASDAAVTGNMVIVPAAGGAISVFASNATHLVLDLFGFWAP